MIEPGGKQVDELPLGPASMNCDAFEIGFRERGAFPSLTRDDALLSDFRVGGSQGDALRAPDDGNAGPANRGRPGPGRPHSPPCPPT